MPNRKIVPTDMGKVRVEKASKFMSDFLISVLLFTKRTKKKIVAIPVRRINLE
ncbi:hypothetical protein D3C73_1406430 [compost metagenome]